ncbi:MAG: peptidoglycan-binding domain-containing protein [Christensenellaceae bacterium]
MVIVYNSRMKKYVILLVFLFIFALPLCSTAAEDRSEVIMQGDSGQEVLLLQQRLNELGYLNYRPTGKFSDMTVTALKKFQTVNGIDPDGQAGIRTQNKLFSDSALKNPLNPDVTKVSGPAYNGDVAEKGLLSSWENISPLFPEGSTATITDYNTGTTYKVQRTGGVNCAHVVTAQEADYDSYLYTFGGSSSWEHRPVLAEIGGQTYAASMFGMPTGGETTNASGMKGYTVLYFNNSKTDVMSIADEEHIIAIAAAAQN